MEVDGRQCFGLDWGWSLGFGLICTAFAVGLIIMPSVFCGKRFQFSSPYGLETTLKPKLTVSILNNFLIATESQSNNTSKTKTSVLVLNNFLIAP